MEEQIYFKNHDGENLAGTLHLPDQPSKFGIVLGHCFTCTRHTNILRRLAKDLTEEGFIALRFDFSGNGQSEGEFSQSTYSKQITEMQKAVEIVASNGAAWIGMAGHSMGGLISFLTASQTESVNAVCAIGSRITTMKATHFLSQTQREILENTGQVSFTSRARFLTVTEDFFSDADHFELQQILQAFHKPLLMVNGDKDEIIPVREADRAREISNGSVDVEIIAGADNMFSREEHRERVSALVVDWFKKQSK
jgi:alpha-beta hydrolase superfamily lysophospholipase